MSPKKDPPQKMVTVTLAPEIADDMSSQDFKLRRGLGFAALKSRQPKFPMEFDCYEADCGVCIFRVLEGTENLSPPTQAEKDYLQALHAEEGERLGCQCRLFGDVTIRVDNEPPFF